MGSREVNRFQRCTLAHTHGPTYRYASSLEKRRNTLLHHRHVLRIISNYLSLFWRVISLDAHYSAPVENISAMQKQHGYFILVS